MEQDNQAGSGKWSLDPNGGYFSDHLVEVHLGENIEKYHVLRNPNGEGWVIGIYFAFVGDYQPLEEEGEDRMTFKSAEEAMGYVESTLVKTHGGKPRNKYRMVISADVLYNPVTKKFEPEEMEAEVFASNEEEAKEIVKDDYASELGTDPDEIRIVKCEEI